MHDGDHELVEGDVLPFPRGPEGGHQVRNDGDAVARVLIVAATTDPDVAEYPETGKVAHVQGGAEEDIRSTVRRHTSPA
jgi:uncharacterized cupin superfamily protein